LWPGAIIVALLWLWRFGAPAVAGPIEELMVRGISSLAGTVAVVIWWLFFSRAAWRERWAVAGAMVAAVAIPLLIGDESIGLFWLPMYGLPVLFLVLVVSAAVADRLVARHRLAAMTAAILIACVPWTAIRLAGITGNGVATFEWRWQPTAEERLLAHAAVEPPPAPAPVPDVNVEPAPTAANTPERETAGSAGAPSIAWSGFRGSRRDGVIAGVRLETDWTASPPVALWRRPIGPGWSSFAVLGDVLYTQEQRGDEEIVSAYRLGTGEPVWMHRDPARFYETNGGAGPRSTPAVSNGRIYSLGATGILNALDAVNGGVVWSRNAAAAASVAVPIWGFSGSPLVVDDLVIVSIAGTLAAFDLATGAPRWQGGGGDGYSSPHLVTIGGVTQILFMSATGTTSVAPADGKPLWTHAWPSGAPIVQPAITPEGDVLLADGGLSGLRRIAVAHGSDGWNVAERWTSNRLKPHFNDFVVHAGYGYGFDGAILACINLQDGARVWKGGRYGQGQLVLLPDQDLLLVLSEEGELVLVQASPEQFKEIARAPGINGKTWNHPVLVGDILLVRNGEEMAAFRLTLAR
jgi:outer membrane protein assembly factor BamB